jgi:hypothetical protein
VGDPSYGLIETAVFADPDPSGTVCAFFNSCADFGAYANLEGSPLEDLPVYVVPATTVTEISNLAASAQRYGITSGSRVTVLLGDRFGGHDVEMAESSIEHFRQALLNIGYPKRELRQAAYPDVGSETEREDAFVDAINDGSHMIIGWGHPTGGRLWPGGFVEGDFDWAGRLTTPQTAVALLPNCYTIGEQFDDPHDPCAPQPCETPTLVKQGLFASTTGTTLAFATGQLNGAFGVEYEMWAEILALEAQDTAVGTPWPRIVWDAKNRALTQYPDLERFLRSVGSVGTMVRKLAPVVTSTEQEVATGRLSLRTLRNASALPTLEFHLPEAVQVDLTVYDVTGRLVAKLYSAQTGPGAHRVSWSGRSASGGRVASGLYVVRLVTSTGESATAKVVVTR